MVEKTRSNFRLTGGKANNSCVYVYSKREKTVSVRHSSICALRLDHMFDGIRYTAWLGVRNRSSSVARQKKLDSPSELKKSPLANPPPLLYPGS